MALALHEVAAAGYRSLRRIRFPVRRLSVFVGANGVGKTNLYRVLQLLQAALAAMSERAERSPLPDLPPQGGKESQ